jgi:hypothetical protein
VSDITIKQLRAAIHHDGKQCLSFSTIFNSPLAPSVTQETTPYQFSDHPAWDRVFILFEFSVQPVTLKLTPRIWRRNLAGELVLVKDLPQRTKTIPHLQRGIDLSADIVSKIDRTKHLISFALESDVEVNCSISIYTWKD